MARLDTRLHSLNVSIGGGLPKRTVTEIAGHNFTGKTTFGLYLNGLLAAPSGKIFICDIEPMQGTHYMDKVFKPTGFGGDLYFVPGVDKDGKPMPSEKQVNGLADAFYLGMNGGLLDSVSSLYPGVEEDTEVGERNMGLRAIIMSMFMRKAIQRLRSVPQECGVVLINHLRQQIGSQYLDTPGGKAIQDYSATRLRVASQREDNYWIMKGKVVKRRFWGDETKVPDTFEIIIVPGGGISIGLSAVQDCVTAGLAEKENGRVKLAGKTFGLFSRMVERQDDLDLFAPFFAALKG